MSFHHTFQTTHFHASGVADGNMANRYGEHTEVVEHRARFLRECGVSHLPVALMEVSHADDISRVRGSQLTEGEVELIPAEALHTNDDGVVLALLTADCLPVAFIDAENGVRALAHLGWRPITLGLASGVVRELALNYGSRPEDLTVVIGPSIRAQSYAFSEVEQEQDASWAEYLTRDAHGLIHIDLHARVIDELRHAGIPEDAIVDCGIDTYTDTAFFSHARSRATGEPEGRFMSVLAPMV